MKYFIFILFIFSCQLEMQAQQIENIARIFPKKNYMLSQYDFARVDSINTYVLQYFTDTANVSLLYPSYVLIGIEKQGYEQMVFVYADTTQHKLVAFVPEKNVPALSTKKKPFLQVHGNIYYDVYYQSSIDTPFYERDIYQHTIRTYLDVTIKDQYPLRVNFSTRFSNSGMFRDITGLGLQFNPQQFKNTVKERIQQYVLQKLLENKKLDSLKSILR